MKAEELPINTTAMMIIIVVVVAILIVFSLLFFGRNSEQSESLTNFSSDAVTQGLSPVDRAMFIAKCDARCANAKTIARGVSPNDCSAQAADSGFCEDRISDSGAYYFCDKFYSKEGLKPCTLTLKDSSTAELTCSPSGVEQC